MSADYPRDLIGYASNPPHPQWPGEARIALSFVLNTGAYRALALSMGGAAAILAVKTAVAPMVAVLNRNRPEPARTTRRSPSCSASRGTAAGLARRARSGE